MATEDDLKSRMRENRTSGSVRGSDILHIVCKYNDRNVELSTRRTNMRKNYFVKLIN